jgi:predicted adenylyl cyclase CyaB
MERTGFALRIRETKDQYSRRTTAALECKILCDGQDHSLCHEHEIPLADTKGMRHILDDIGLKEFLVIDKERIIYQYRKAKFFFDKIKGLGQGLEIEIMAKNNLVQTKAKLLALAADLGINKEEILTKSLTHLAMQKLGKF